MEPRLLNIYDRAADWLKFAEAKNAGLVAFNAAVVAGLVGAWDKFEFLDCAQPWILGIAVGALVIAAAISLAAMIPRLAFLDAKLQEGGPPSSIHYFDHIRQRYSSPEAYVDAVAVAYGESRPENGWSQGELDLAGQIIQLSRIAHHKYAHFHWAAWITIFVVGTPVLVSIAVVVKQFLQWRNKRISAQTASTEGSSNSAIA